MAAAIRRIIGTSFTGGGRLGVRLCSWALVAARCKPTLVAIIAVARKLLTILNAVMRAKSSSRDVEYEQAQPKAWDLTGSQGLRRLDGSKAGRRASARLPAVRIRNLPRR
jgi:hypothetical protein